MNTTNLFGASQAAAALSLIGATALGENRNDLYKQILVALANKTGGGGGTGNVVGPASSTDGAVALWDGATGKLLKDSTAFITGSGTLAFGAGPFTLTVPATGTAALLEVANVFTVNGAASTPAMSVTGTVFTGGSATTTKPLFLIETAGTTSNLWSTDGTMFGVNAPSGFTGDLINCQVNGGNRFKIVCGTTSTKLRLSGFGTFIEAYDTDDTTLAAWLSYNRWFCADYTVSDNTASLGSGAAGFVGVNLGSGASVTWSSAPQFYAGSRDVGVARGSSGVIKVTDGTSGYGAVDASAFKVSGVAGASGTITAASTVTVVNGIITNIA